MDLNIISHDKLLLEGFEFVKNFFDCNRGEIISVKAKKTDILGYKIIKNGNNCIINYGSNNEFFHALSELLLTHKVKSFVKERQIAFKKLGVMLDCARNAVPTVETLRLYLMNMALLGYNYLGLYVEDCFELEKYPMFGYMRGKYSVKELKQINRIGQTFGIEIVPFIQTLGHLYALSKHADFEDVYDIRGTLMADEDKTYRLIEEMLKTMRGCFSTDRINIGMDESYMMGRGRYLKKFNYSPTIDLFNRHLDRVNALCKKYKFKASIWSDMYVDHYVGPHYRNDLQYSGEKIGLDDNITPVYWDYGNTKKENYANKIKIQQKLFDKVAYAGSLQRHSLFASKNRWAMETNTAALQACIEGGVDDYLVTSWADNGAECSIFANIPSLIYISENAAKTNDSSNRYDKLCYLLTKLSFDEFCCLDLPNTFNNKEYYRFNPSKYLFYEDVLKSSCLFNIFDEFQSDYQKVCLTLKKISNKKSPYSYIFKSNAALSDFLAVKSTLSKKIKESYDSGAREKLKDTADDIISEAVKKLEKFYKLFRAQWSRENKNYGLEILDYRVGAIRSRLLDARDIIDNYVKNNISNIDILEHKRMVKVDSKQKLTSVFDAYRIMFDGKY